MWRALKNDEIKEKELRQRGLFKLRYKILIDVEQIKLLGGDLPETRYKVDYKDGKWICLVFNRQRITGKTVDKLIKNLAKFIKQDEAVLNVKIDTIFIL